MNQQRPSRREIAQAIRLVQQEIRWKPNSAQRHLRKRIKWGHLPLDATLDSYEAIIKNIITQIEAVVYLFWYQNTPYVTVTTMINRQNWLVMFALDGLLETAFVIETDDYLSQPNFEQIATVSEVQQND